MSENSKAPKVEQFPKTVLLPYGEYLCENYGQGLSPYKLIRETLNDSHCTDGVMITLSIDELAGLLRKYGSFAETYAAIKVEEAVRVALEMASERVKYGYTPEEVRVKILNLQQKVLDKLKGE